MGRRESPVRLAGAGGRAMRRATLLAGAAAIAALAGCGGGPRTVTVETRTVTAPGGGTSTTGTPAQQGQAPPSGVPSAGEAESFAARTYVVQPTLGKRVFKITGSVQTVTASDGSSISAFPAVLADSGDGTGQAVLLFRGTQFLGWATSQMAIRLTVSQSGSDIAVNYGDFEGNDPLCCPSSTKTVDYSWDGSRIVADGDPPLEYGKPGDQLQLSPG